MLIHPKHKVLLHGISTIVTKILKAEFIFLGIFNFKGIKLRYEREIGKTEFCFSF